MNYFITCKIFSEEAKTFTQSRKAAKIRKERKIQKANIFGAWSLNDFVYSLRLSVFACAFVFWFLPVRLMEATA